MANYYVDPAGGNDTTGDGTSGTPWATVQKALTTIGQSETGDQINVKAGSADVLTAALDISAWTPSYTKPLVIAGYTSAADDGGIGEISGNATYAIINNTAKNYVYIRDMKVGNCGSNHVLNLGQSSSVTRSEIHTGSGATNYGVGLLQYGSVCNCHINGIGGYAVGCANEGVRVIGNYIAGTPAQAVRVANHRCTVALNIISISGASDGIVLTGNCYATTIIKNSIISPSGTGKGISAPSSIWMTLICADNAFDGFDGSGGKAWNIVTTAYAAVIANNKYYNSNVAPTTPTFCLLVTGNADAGSTLFSKSGSDTFANRVTYFTPTSVVEDDAYYNGQVVGAITPAIAAAGGLMSHPGMSGRMNG